MILEVEPTMPGVGDPAEGVETTIGVMRFVREDGTSVWAVFLNSDRMDVVHVYSTQEARWLGAKLAEFADAADAHQADGLT